MIQRVGAPPAAIPQAPQHLAGAEGGPVPSGSRGFPLARAEANRVLGCQESATKPALFALIKTDQALIQIIQGEVAGLAAFGVLNLQMALNAAVFRWPAIRG